MRPVPRQPRALLERPAYTGYHAYAPTPERPAYTGYHAYAQPPYTGAHMPYGYESARMTGMKVPYTNYNIPLALSECLPKDYQEGYTGSYLRALEGGALTAVSAGVIAREVPYVTSWYHPHKPATGTEDYV